MTSNPFDPNNCPSSALITEVHYRHNSKTIVAVVDEAFPNDGAGVLTTCLQRDNGVLLTSSTGAELVIDTAALERIVYADEQSVSKG